MIDCKSPIGHSIGLIDYLIYIYISRSLDMLNSSSPDIDEALKDLKDDKAFKNLQERLKLL